MNKIFCFGDYLLDGFDADIARLEKYRDRKTGFFNLDRKIVFVPAMIFLGGLPGLGKSSFAWQLSYQLAEAGEYVIYCSYEMPREAMTAKMLAREMCRTYNAESGVCLTAEEIRTGAFRDDEKVAKKFSYVRDQIVLPKCDTLNGLCTDLPIEELMKLLNAEAKAAGDKPLTVVIDYLQLVGVKDKKLSSPREKIDYVIQHLKKFQVETCATVIIISAFNRASSVGGLETKLSSFKESGGIEYSAEICWGLQPVGAAGMSIDKLGEFLKQKPREMELACVKNRYGQCFSVYFNYWSAYDYFEVATKPVDTPKASKDI